MQTVRNASICRHLRLEISFITSVHYTGCFNNGYENLNLNMPPEPLNAETDPNEKTVLRQQYFGNVFYLLASFGGMGAQRQATDFNIAFIGVFKL